MPWNWHGVTKHNWQNAGFNPLRRDDLLLKAEVSSRREPRARVAEGKIPDPLPSTERSEVLNKTPENRLRWLQKVLPRISSGEVPNTIVFDIVAHSKFNAGMSSEMGRQMREVISKHFDVFSEKQRRRFQSSMSTLGEFPDAVPSSDTVHQGSSVAQEGTASSDGEIGEEPEQTKKVAPGRGLRAVLFRSIEDADQSSRAAPSKAVQVPAHRSDDDLRNMSSEELEAKLESLRRADADDAEADSRQAELERLQRADENDADGSILLNSVLTTDSNADTARSAEQGANTQPKSSSSSGSSGGRPKAVPEASDSTPMEKRPRALRAALAAAQRGTSPRKSPVRRIAREASSDGQLTDDSDADRHSLRNKSTDELLAELATLDSRPASDRAKPSGGRSVGSNLQTRVGGKRRDRSPIGKVHIPGRAYRTGCTYLPGQSPSPMRTQEASRSPVAAEPVRESKSQPRRKSKKGKGCTKEKNKGRGHMRSRSRRGKKRKRRSSTSSSPGVGGFDSALPDLEALLAAQQAAAQKVEAMCASAAKNGGKDVELLRSAHQNAVDRLAALPFSLALMRGSNEARRQRHRI